MPVIAGRLDQPLDLGICQVLALAQFPIGGRLGGSVPPTVRFSVSGGTSRRFDLAMTGALPLLMTVLFVVGNRTVDQRQSGVPHLSDSAAVVAARIRKSAGAAL